MAAERRTSVTKLDSPLPVDSSEARGRRASLWLGWVTALAALMGSAAALITALRG